MSQLFDELKHLKNRTIMLAFIAPVIAVLIFAYMLGGSRILDAGLAVVDPGDSQYSRQLIDKIDASPYVAVKAVYREPTEPETLLKKADYLAVLVLPAELEQNRLRGRTSTIGLVVDDTVLSAAANLRQGVAEVIATENAGAIAPRLVGMGLTSAQAGALLNTLSLRQRTPFNPAMSYINFMVMGIAHVVLMALFMMQAAGVIPRLRLRERWPSDRRFPLGLLSRLLPYMLIFAAATLLVLGLAKRFLALRFTGGVLDYALPLLLYLLAVSLLGMILGCLSKTPSQVMSRLMPVIAPSFFLSNLTLPLITLPAPLQMLSQALPLSWYVRFYQGVAIRGASLADLSADLGGFLIYVAALGLVLVPLLIREARVS
ncbi:MAG: ABC transporter permease [Gracilibacteraceae bacterium]|jgi:ABC-2 type transport system permease protein|nr:ABC transporter permease [Gracilibacteraceae bacterium]